MHCCYQAHYSQLTHPQRGGRRHHNLHIDKVRLCSFIGIKMGLLSCLLFAKLFTTSPQSDQLLNNTVCPWLAKKYLRSSEVWQCAWLPVLPLHLGSQEKWGKSPWSWCFGLGPQLHQQAGAVLRAVSCDVEETETRCDRKSDCDGTAEAGLTPTFWCREADPYFHRGKPLLYSTTTGGSAVRARIKSLLSSFMPWQICTSSDDLKLPWLYISRIRSGAWCSIKYQ